ncbi:MAG: hypothetical protein PHI12_06530 [Dehalococcoidales bacterium]|nr:hypothetical protein [Dehalococcoidales bacterium]
MKRIVVKTEQPETSPPASSEPQPIVENTAPPETKAQANTEPQPTDEETTPETKERAVVKGFRLKPSEEVLIDQLAQYAHAAGFIKEPSFQAYMMFALNCAYARLQQDFQNGVHKK